LSNGNKFTQNGRLTLVAERVQRTHPMVVYHLRYGHRNERGADRPAVQHFSQADASTTKKFGTGLGLAITQHCQLLGGDITVTSHRSSS
jgi:hypothetical protein